MISQHILINTKYIFFFSETKLVHCHVLIYDHKWQKMQNGIIQNGINGT